MSIDLWTVILTIVSFLLLYFLLNTFLYKPLLKFMDDRKARIELGLAEGKKAEQAKAENARELEEELRRTGGEAKKLLSDSKAADEKEREALIAAARGDAAQASLEARKRVQDEENAAVTEVENRMPELVAALTGRLIGDDAAVSANAAVIERCAAQAGKS